MWGGEQQPAVATVTSLESIVHAAMWKTVEFEAHVDFRPLVRGEFSAKVQRYRIGLYLMNAALVPGVVGGMAMFDEDEVSDEN